MGGVDDGVDALAREIRSQTFGAAEAADALRDRRRRGIGGRARKRQNGLDPGLTASAARARSLPTFRRE